MAVAPTGNIFKALSFDNVSSRTYGVYITGEAVYNAPGRDVEMVEIPGRNGSFALDKGRFQNIEVSYPAGIFADNETDFAEAISDFRNFLCSRRGYVRLTDEYNPNEYRMAIYKSGLEVSPAQLKAGEFNIVFDCKPQRWLTSGETAVTVANNGTLTNPTLFDSSPLLAVTGYGDIGINGETITVQNAQLGETDITSSISGNTVTLNTTNLNAGDSIYKKDNGLPCVVVDMSASNATILKVNRNGAILHGTCAITRRSNTRVVIRIQPNGVSFAKGTNKTITTKVPLSIDVDGTMYNNAEITVTTQYTASSDTVTMSVTRTDMPTATYTYTYNWTRFYGNSTKTLLPTPMYIDLDIGEAYGTINGEITSFNNIVSIPAELPTLKSGTNTFTKSNTVTQLKVTPRWRKV